MGDVINVAHANDLTYVPKNNQLLSSWCSVDASKYSIISPSTLGKTSDVDLGKDFFAIAYDPISDRYALAKSGQEVNSYTIMVFDGELTYEREFKTAILGYTAQGIFCDSKYIYYTQSHRSNLGTSGNIITVYDWDGNLQMVFRTPNNSDEIESMFWYGDAFYACFNGSSDYIAKLVPQNQ